MDKKPRLIDADALVKCITKMPFGDMTSDQLRMVCRIHDMIIDAPTIKAEPVRHGRWIVVCDKFGYALGMKCSECGRRVKNCGENYCPKCGAKMDGGKENDRE